MTERKPPGVSFETWVDNQIARGQARGDFENLTGAGRPLPREALSDNAYDWAVAKARREGVETAAMLPPGLALRRERDELPERAARLVAETDVRALAEDYNTRVRAFWRQPQPSRWSPVPGLADVEALVSGWLLARPADPPASSSTDDGAAERLPWWRRIRRRPR